MVRQARPVADDQGRPSPLRLAVGPRAVHTVVRRGGRGRLDVDLSRMDIYPCVSVVGPFGLRGDVVCGACANGRDGICDGTVGVGVRCGAYYVTR